MRTSPQRSVSTQTSSSSTEADDLHISPPHKDGVTYGTPTWVWSVTVGDALYVRAYDGQNPSCYRAALRQKAGRITAACMTREVTFEPVERPVNDVSDDAQVAAMVERAVAEFGRLDAAFNNAWVMARTAPTADSSGEDWNCVIAVNLRAEGSLGRVFGRRGRHVGGEDEAEEVFQRDGAARPGGLKLQGRAAS